MYPLFVFAYCFGSRSNMYHDTVTVTAKTAVGKDAQHTNCGFFFQTTEKQSCCRKIEYLLLTTWKYQVPPNCLFLSTKLPDITFQKTTVLMLI
jgi:hypothetical protein